MLDVGKRADRYQPGKIHVPGQLTGNVIHLHLVARVRGVVVGAGKIVDRVRVEKPEQVALVVGGTPSRSPSKMEFSQPPSVTLIISQVVRTSRWNAVFTVSSNTPSPSVSSTNATVGMLL